MQFISDSIVNKNTQKCLAMHTLAGERNESNALHSNTKGTRSSPNHKLKTNPEATQDQKKKQKNKTKVKKNMGASFFVLDINP